ncbi:tRNA (cytidine(34)-2'-O)-methyltransferase [Bartonella sp. DGB1]|uniref:tRNA (cytidine(34)-2'-O)-methyltransferase n=1 Tax=Bartonella sp. DGB1 TaxID=3239807 RepID=UPI0035240571
MSLHIVLFQPDIPGNSGTILRMVSCLDLQLHIIEPAGFDISDKSFKRAGMDYIANAHLVKHKSWQHFLHWKEETNKRLILLTTKSETPYSDFNFNEEDLILFGRESAGVPEYVHNNTYASLTIPMKKDARSLNLAMAVAMVTGEAIRQINLIKN